ncbi:MAG: histidinol dehydrogenase [Alphaproteobacteria bacterium]|nr:histidinol dehydrogenase [Alphaproteobacteria bacterium]
MPLRLDAAAPDFEHAFAAFLGRGRGDVAAVDASVAEIIAGVRARGDAAVADYTRRFDRLNLAPGALRIEPAEIAAAEASAPAEARKALAFAHGRITEFHARQRPEDLSYTDAAGVRLGWRWTALDSVGVYVPGGTASYPSSVLMNVVPARVAGVARVVMTVPTPDGKLDPLVLAAARLAGVDEVWRIGGAQAVAALAFGTESIRPVDKIVGPGNAYVAAAKRQVFGQVGIDSIAGPSEILVVADRGCDPRWIAADLLSQAEHDAVAQAILMTDDAAFADRVAAEIETLLRTLPRAAIAGASWRDHGAIIVLKSLDAAPALIDRIAPEHLELACDGAEALAKRVRHAGAIFLGRMTPEAVGDYVAGPNHVLPTSRTARFSSGLGVLDFMKRTTLVGCSDAGLAAIGPAAETLARAERLEAHALSLALRRQPKRLG